MKFAKQVEAIGCVLMPVRFRNQAGKYCKGYDVVQPDGFIRYTFQPVHYSNGDRWLVTGATFQYLKRLTLKGVRFDADKAKYLNIRKD